MPPQEVPVHLLATPFTHAVGAIACPLMKHGAWQMLTVDTDPARLLQRLEQTCVTYLFLPPTVIYRLLAHADIRRYNYASFEYFVYGAAPMSVDKLREAIAVFGPVMAQFFGQTEIPLMCTFLSPSDHLVNPASESARRLASAGRATKGTSVGIMNDEGGTRTIQLMSFLLNTGALRVLRFSPNS